MVSNAIEDRCEEPCAGTQFKNYHHIGCVVYIISNLKDEKKATIIFVSFTSLFMMCLIFVL